MSDIANGIYDIHKKNYVHADIKPDNILIDGDFNAKISDLGIIKNKNDKTDNGIGNSYYLPYEFYTGKYGKNVDVFSFGLVMYHLFTKETHKWSQQRPSESRELIIDASNKIRLHFVDALVDLCVIKEPEERMEILVFRNITLSICTGQHFTCWRTRATLILNSETKDRVILRFADEIFAATLSEIVLEAKLCKAGLSLNDLRKPRDTKAS
jgi:serine/threonine protein kinase